MLAAILRPKGRAQCPSGSAGRCRPSKRAYRALMQAEDPDADDGRWVDAGCAPSGARLQSDAVDATPVAIRALIKGAFIATAKGSAAGLGSLELQHLGRDRYQVRLQRKWEAVKKTARLRRTFLTSS